MLGKKSSDSPISNEKQEKEEENGEVVKPKSLYKWRMFFYIEKVKNIPNTTADSNRGTIGKERTHN